MVAHLCICLLSVTICYASEWEVQVISEPTKTVATDTSIQHFPLNII